MAPRVDFDPGSVCLDSLGVAERTGERGSMGELPRGPSRLQGPNWGAAACLCAGLWGRPLLALAHCRHTPLSVANTSDS